jgi:kinesin family protein 13
MQTNNEVAIRVLHKQRGTDSVWSTDTLDEKVLTMRDMYERIEEGGSLVDETIGPDPFYDLEQHALLGVANISLECLLHDIEFVYDAPVVAPTGKICGKLKLSVKRVPTLLDREMDGDDVDTYSSWSTLQSQPSMMEDLMDIRHGQPLSCQVTVIESSGLPKEYCHYVFCQYQFWGQEEPMIIPPLQGSINSDQKIVDRVQFSHSQTFTVEITEDFLSHVEEGVLGVEVWGHRRSGFMDLHVPPGDPENEGRRQKSFPEKLVSTTSLNLVLVTNLAPPTRWSELTQRLELWVEIMELNDQVRVM